MTTDELIASLAQDLSPVAARAPRLRIAFSAAIGIAVATVLLSITFGLRSDLDIAMAGTAFWMKTGYTASLALIALTAAMTLARPETVPPRWLWLLAFPVAALAAIAALELSTAPPDHRIAMWLGQTWRVCPAIIIMLSLPIMATLMIAYRRFAPSHLRLTGAVIGLGAGAAAATVYCLHCPEASATFVLSWYSLGIGFAATIGAAIGPRLLRW